MFKGKDSTTLHPIFRYIIREIYDRLFDIDADALAIPENFYKAIAKATVSARVN